MSRNIASKLDEILKNDIGLDTRAGLRFLVELVRDAFEYIEQERELQKTVDDKLSSFESRIKNVEDGFFQFLKAREKEQEKAEDERKFYRRAVIGGIIAIVLSQIAQWFLALGGKLP